MHAHLEAIDEMNDEEGALAPGDPSEVDAGAIRDAADRINARLRAKLEAGEGGDAEARELRRAAGAIERDYLPRMDRYERQQAAFAGRKSFSKTDPDATFMRMKDDAMGNGQLKAGYNVQAGTENQFIVDTTVHQRPGDTACAIPHLEHVKERVGRLPAALVADAGYGSEENCAYLEGEGVDAYVKHSEFFRECRNRKWREDEMRVANWAYDEGSDAYTCPEGRALAFLGESTRVERLAGRRTRPRQEDRRRPRVRWCRRVHCRGRQVRRRRGPRSLRRHLRAGSGLPGRGRQGLRPHL